MPVAAGHFRPSSSGGLGALPLITILIYRPTYIFSSTGLLRPDIFVRPLQKVLMHCRCPLDGECLTKCVVYRSTVTEITSNDQEMYIGFTENEVRTRFSMHKSSFKPELKRTSTTFSNPVWKLKQKHLLQYQMGDRQKVEPVAPGEKMCKLCLQEKFSILRSVNP